MKILIQLLLFTSLVLSSCNRKATMYIQQGDQQHYKDNYRDAIKSYTMAIESNLKNKTEAYYGRASSYYDLHQYNEAKTDLLTALATENKNDDKMNTSLYFLLGRTNSYLGEKQLEIENYESALKYTSDDARTLVTLGYIYGETGENEKAIEVINRIIDNNETDAFAYNNRAKAHINLKQYDKAISDLDKSKSIDPNNPFLYRNYYDYYMALDNREKACKSIKYALLLDVLDYGSQEQLDLYNKLAMDCNKE